MHCGYCVGCKLICTWKRGMHFVLWFRLISLGLNRSCLCHMSGPLQCKFYWSHIVNRLKVKLSIRKCLHISICKRQQEYMQTLSCVLYAVDVHLSIRRISMLVVCGHRYVCEPLICDLETRKLHQPEHTIIMYVAKLGVHQCECFNNSVTTTGNDYTQLMHTLLLCNCQ